MPQQEPSRPLGAAVIVSFPSRIVSLSRINGSSSVVAGLADGRLAAWDGRDSAPGMVIQPHSSSVLAVGSTADGREVWSVADAGSLCHTLTTGDKPTSSKLDVGSRPARAAAFSSDGAVVATGDDLGAIRVFDTASGALKHRLTGHRTEIQCLSLRPASPMLASASAEADLLVWDVATGRQIASAQGDLSLFALDFSPRDGTLASGGVDRRLTLRDAMTFKVLGELALKAPKMVATLAWSPDGRLVAAGDIDDTTLSKGEIQLIDARTRSIVARVDTGGNPASALVFTGDGKVLVAGIGSELHAFAVSTPRSLVADA